MTGAPKGKIETKEQSLARCRGRTKVPHRKQDCENQKKKNS